MLKSESSISCNYLQANTLLQNNLQNAKASLDVLVGDLQFLRDQVTITQVCVIYSIELHLYLADVLVQTTLQGTHKSTCILNANIFMKFVTFTILLPPSIT